MYTCTFLIVVCVPYGGCTVTCKPHSDHTTETWNCVLSSYVYVYMPVHVAEVRASHIEVFKCHTVCCVCKAYWPLSLSVCACMCVYPDVHMCSVASGRADGGALRTVLAASL